jgi:hypothetical protein
MIVKEYYLITNFTNIDKQIKDGSFLIEIEVTI